MNKKVMTVDDSASVRQMVSFTLRTNGYDVVEAVDGRDALEKLEKEAVDIVIADVNMPRLGGIELVRKVREHPTRKFIPIILLTTESQVDKRMEGKAAGATGWIVKPFQQDQLISTIKKVVG